MTTEEIDALDGDDLADAVLAAQGYDEISRGGDGRISGRFAGTRTWWHLVDPLSWEGAGPLFDDMDKAGLDIELRQYWAKSHMNIDFFVSAEPCDRKVLICRLYLKAHAAGLLT